MAPFDRAREIRRLHRFGLHLASYFAVMILIVPLNLWLGPDEPWFLWPMIGWSPVLTVHAAWAMGLFDVLREPARLAPGRSEGDAEKARET
ncbi:MAG: 2TM domain-containing protein [Rhodospirillales bacterium]